MKRFLVALGVVAVGAGLAAPTAGAASARYFVGGSPGASKVSFVIRDGSVDRALLTAHGVRCADGAKSNLFKPFRDPLELDGNRFLRRHHQNGVTKFAFGGHVHGAAARGRMRMVDGELGEHYCDTGSLRWEAKTVSRQRWLRADGRLAGPGR